jgi:hypothetical protein
MTDRSSAQGAEVRQAIPAGLACGHIGLSSALHTCRTGTTPVRPCGNTTDLVAGEQTAEQIHVLASLEGREATGTRRLSRKTTTAARQAAARWIYARGEWAAGRAGHQELNSEEFNRASTAAY